MIFAPEYKPWTITKEKELLARLNNDERILLQIETRDKKNLQAIDDISDFKIFFMRANPNNYENNIVINTVWDFLLLWDNKMTSNNPLYDYDSGHIVITPKWISKFLRVYEDIDDFRVELMLKHPNAEPEEIENMLDESISNGVLIEFNSGHVIQVPQEFMWYDGETIDTYNNRSDHSWK
jgi:hypothetical protein